MTRATPAWRNPTRRLAWRVWLRLVFCWLVALPAAHAADITLNGIQYRPLSDVATQYGMTVDWEVPGKTIRLRNQYCELECTLSERSLRLNDEPIALSAAIELHGGKAFISKNDFDNNLFPLLSPGSIPGAIPALHRIIIDPGHGGIDPGTEVFPPGQNGNTAKAIDNEKTHTLQVGFLLADLLRKRGYDVVMTRTTDVKIELPDRPALANKAQGDLYISIHFNNGPASVSGIETWVLPPPGQLSTNQKPTDEADKQVWPGNRFDLWNTIAGFSVERAVTHNLSAPNRGVKHARDAVLRYLNMPGLLVECGFLSNTFDRTKIDTADYRLKIATGIADGVDLYKSTLDRLQARNQSLAQPTRPAGTANAAATSAAVPVNKK